jgi:outer membrane protein TolC
LAAAESLLRTAVEVRHAWVRAVATQQAADYVAQVKEAAESRAEMARRLNRAGNLSSLAYAREQTFYAEAAVQLARARREAAMARERLVRVLGVWGEDAAFVLPPRLPELPVMPREAVDLERRAIEDRLDLRIARLDIDGLARSLGLTRATRFVNVLEAGYLRNRESGKPLQDGYEIRLEIPLFDWGDAKVARAEFAYMGAVNRLAARAVAARSEVREAYLDYRLAFDLARQYRAEILPVRQHISEEMLLRYNGMLVSIFELLADVRDQIAAVTAALAAERDFWIADATLTYATLVGVGSAMASSPIALPGTERAAGH